MTSAKKEIITEYLSDRYGPVDRWGNIKFVKGSKTYRFKVKEKVVRLEVKVDMTDFSEWRRIRSFSYSEMLKIIKNTKEASK